jgi:general secretion pathway protein D
MRPLHIALLVLGILVLLLGPVAAQEPPGGEEKKKEETPPEGTMQINFNNVSLREIIKAMEKITRKRFLFDEGLVADRKTSLFSSEPIPLSEILSVFRSILEVEGLAIVRTGAKDAEIYKVVEISTALKRPTPIYTKKELSDIRPGDAIITLLFDLKHVQPMEVTPVLASLVTLPEGIVAIPGTKLLRITDFADNVRRIVSILELVDQESAKVRTETIKLENVDPADLAAEIQPLVQLENRIAAGVVQKNVRQQLGRLAKQKPGSVLQFAGAQYTPITLIPISRLGSIVVTAEVKQMAFVKDLIRKLDVVDPEQKILKYYEIKYADPTSVAAVIGTVFGISSGGGAARRPAPKGKKGQPAPRAPAKKAAAVIPDDELGKLIVVASKKMHEEIVAVIKNLDVIGPSDSVLRYYEIKNTELHETAKIISQLFGLALDSDMTRVQRWMSRRGRGRGRGQQPLAVDKVVIPDENLNTLLIVADKETHAKVEEALAKIDVKGVGEKIVRFYNLANADAEQVANTLGNIFDITVSQAVTGGGRNWWRRRRTPRVTSQADKNAVIVPNTEQHRIIVVASKTVQQEIAGIITDLDTKSPDENVLTYYPVEYTDIHEAARVVSQVFGLNLGTMTQASGSRGRGRGRWRGPQSELTKEPVVIPDEALSTLIVVAPAKLQKEIADVIRKIDVQGPGEKIVRYYKVKHASVEEISSILGNIFGISVGQTSNQRNRYWWRRRSGQDQRTEKNAIILPNEELNTIVVVASEKVQKEVAGVIESLDIEGPGANVLRYFPVKNTDITETANILSQIFGIQVNTPSSGFRSRWWWDDSSEKLTKERVIIPDDNLNAIIVVAPPDVQEEILKVVGKIDVLGPRDNELRFYEVDNEYVSPAAQTLSQLFNIPLGQTQSRGRWRGRGRTTKSSKKFGVDPVIIPDETLGSVIVNAPAEIHAEIKKVLEQLDFLGNQERMSIRFYKLKNTDAETVASTLGGLFEINVSTPTRSSRTSSRRTSSRRSSTPRPSSSRRRRVENPDGTGPLPVGETENGNGETAEDEEEEEEPGAAPSAVREYTYTGQPVIVPDTNLNSLIIIAPNYLHEEIGGVIDKLDVRRPQVLLEIAIIDITTDSNLDFGVEYSTIDGASDNPRGAGFTNFGIGTRTSTGGDGFPDSTTVPANAAQGIFAGITKGAAGSIPILVRALKTDSDVNVRATPILLVNDNEAAAFSALRSEPTTHTSQGTATTNISFSGFVDAGTVLEITPHVSEGNYVRLELMVQVDSWIGSSSTPGIPPPKATNYLQTSITVPDEHVVIIGGLTSTEKSVRQDKIPLLGDIPLLGYLFRREITEEKVKKLFLFIKPVILADKEFVDLNRISDQKLKEASFFLSGRKNADEEKDEEEEDGKKEQPAKEGKKS